MDLIIILTKITGCFIYGFTGALSGFSAIAILMIIAVERYYVLTSPFSYSIFTTRSIIFSLSACWLYSLLWSVLPVFVEGYVLEGYGTSCSLNYFSQTAPNRIMIAMMVLLGFTIPIVIIIFAYTRISCKVCIHERSSLNMNRYNYNNRFKKIELRITKTVLILITTFILTWLPYTFIAVCSLFSSYDYITPTVATLSGFIAKLSTIVNPLIYASYHPEMKRAFSILRMGNRRTYSDYKDTTNRTTLRNLRSFYSKRRKGRKKVEKFHLVDFLIREKGKQKKGSEKVSREFSALNYKSHSDTDCKVSVHHNYNFSIKMSLFASSETIKINKVSSRSNNNRRKSL